MLWLKRIVNDYEFLRCKVSDEIIAYGDFYYEDDEDGLVIKAKVYNQLKERAKRNNFDYSQLNNAVNQREYEMMLKQAERDFHSQTILERKVAKY